LEFDQHLIGHEPAFTGWRNATDAATAAETSASAAASTSVTAQAQRTNPACKTVTNTVTDNPTMRKIPDAPAAVAFAATSRQVSASAAIRNAARSMFANAMPPAERVPLHARAHACTAEMSAHPEKCGGLLRTANPAYAGQRHRQCHDKSRSQCDSLAPHRRASQSNQTAPRHAQTRGQ
jgi:hypothetical protein